MNPLARRLPVWALVLALALVLCACETAQEPSGAAEGPAPGLYTCRRLIQEDLTLDPARTWLRLYDDGKGDLYLDEQEDPGTWSVEGPAFRWDSNWGDGREAEGTWAEEGVLTLTIGKKTGVFVLTGVDYVPEEERPVQPVVTGRVDAPEEEAEDPQQAPAPDQGTAAPSAPSPAGSGQSEEKTADGPAPADEPHPLMTYPCYDGLFYVEYDPQVFTPGPTGGADLVKADGTQIWLARLTTRALRDTWLAGLEAKAADPEYTDLESRARQAGEYPAHVVFYPEANGWTAEAIVDLGADRGREDSPLYAVTITVRGPTRQAVWAEGMQPMLDTFRLGNNQSNKT